MKAQKAKFDFAAASTPSLADVITRVASDPEFPADRRTFTVSSMKSLAKWSAQDASTIAFVEPVIEAQFRKLRASVVGVSEKRLKNARSDLRFVLDRYGKSPRYFAPYSPAARRLMDMLSDKYARCSLSRLFRFLSARGLDPAAMNDAISQEFLDALRREGRLRIAPKTFHQSAIRAWNRAASICSAWPQVQLTIPHYKIRWTQPWASFPRSLEQAVDTFLAAGGQPASLFDEHDRAYPLKPATRETQKDHVRCVASALVLSGIPIAELTDLRSICTPDRFQRALETYVKRREGHLGGYIMGIAWTLVKLARHGGQLTSSEIDKVNRLYKKLAVKRKSEKITDIDRDQALLSQLDDPRVTDALLSLPPRVVGRVLKSGRKTRVEALLVQKAMALELWLCAPLRLSNFASLRLDQHFQRLTLNGTERILVRIPAQEVKNGEALEHYLNDDAANLLDLYVKEFRPLLVSGASPWLFPGHGGRSKVAAVLSGQMKAFVNEATGIDFHPHLIRKITTKLYLDADPGGIEVARRCLGHRDVRTTRLAYTQQQQRAAQLRYLEALEGRRLSAIRQGFDAGSWP